MRINITKRRWTYIQSNVAPEANRAAAMVWRGGQAIR
jgi:hypothetical protein